MLNFTIGPVMTNELISAIGSEQVPYFRTAEFSAITLESERIVQKLANAPKGSRTVFITGSGTASMEAAVINTLTEDDKALVVDGGSFGHRFAELLTIHDIPHEIIQLTAGRTITKDDLRPYDNKGFTAFLINVHETSTGVYYDLDLISEFCKSNKLFLIVDAISSFLADDFNMSDIGADIMITGSQKALACPPGVSLIVLSPKAMKRVASSKTKCMYLNLKDALENAERGQTPFTPAVSILRQINARLKQIESNGGADVEIQRVHALATDFRNKIEGLPFKIFSDSLSNAVTPLQPLTASANDIFITLKKEYDIWVCPNGGEFKDTLFRVGHIGALEAKDNDILISAFKDMKKRGII